MLAKVTKYNFNTAVKLSVIPFFSEPSTVSAKSIALRPQDQLQHLAPGSHLKSVMASGHEVIPSFDEFIQAGKMNRYGAVNDISAD